MDKPIGWLRIVGRNVFFSREEPVGKSGIHVAVDVHKEEIMDEAALKERERCLNLVRNLMAYHENNLRVYEVLVRLLARIKNPKKSTGANGTLLSEQQEMPYDNSTNDSLNKP